MRGVSRARYRATSKSRDYYLKSATRDRPQHGSMTIAIGESGQEVQQAIRFRERTLICDAAENESPAVEETSGAREHHRLGAAVMLQTVCYATTKLRQQEFLAIRIFFRSVRVSLRTIDCFRRIIWLSNKYVGVCGG